MAYVAPQSLFYQHAPDSISHEHTCQCKHQYTIQWWAGRDCSLLQDRPTRTAQYGGDTWSHRNAAPYRMELAKSEDHTEPNRRHDFQTNIPMYHDHAAGYGPHGSLRPHGTPYVPTMDTTYGDGYPAFECSTGGVRANWAPSLDNSVVTQQYRMQMQQPQYLPRQMQESQQHQQHQQYQQVQQLDFQDAVSDSPQGQTDEIKKSRHRDHWARAGRAVARTAVGVGSIAGLGVSIWQGIAECSG